MVVNLAVPNSDYAIPEKGSIVTAFCSTLDFCNVRVIYPYSRSVRGSKRRASAAIEAPCSKLQGIFDRNADIFWIRSLTPQLAAGLALAFAVHKVDASMRWPEGVGALRTKLSCFGVHVSISTDSYGLATREGEEGDVGNLGSR
jgi:hypothetical protein